MIATKIKQSGVLLLAIGSGYAIGLLMHNEPDSPTLIDTAQKVSNLQLKIEGKDGEIAQLKQELERQRALKTASADALHSGKPIHGTPELNTESQATQDLETDSAEAIAAEEVQYEDVVQGIDAVLADVQMQALTNGELTEATREQLYQSLTQDPLSSERVLQTYLANPHSAAGEALRMVLGDFKDANIEAAALAMTSSANDIKDRLAGLELLQQMGLENSATIDVALNIIAEGSDPELIGSALDTLQHQVVSPEQNRQVMAAIESSLNSENADVRRRGVIAYSDWVASADSVSLVIAAMDDPAVDVRAGAAFAMSKVKSSTPEIREALIRKVSDPEEDWTVREQAWHALERQELDEKGHEVYAEFKAQRDVQVEQGN